MRNRGPQKTLEKDRPRGQRVRFRLEIQKSESTLAESRLESNLRPDGYVPELACVALEVRVREYTLESWSHVSTCLHG